MNHILVLVEHLRGEIRDITFEMLAQANRLANGLNTRVTAAVLSADLPAHGNRLSSYCDELLVVEHPALKDYNADTYEPVLTEIISSERPRLTMIAHSALGADLAPVLAVRTGLPVISDVIGIHADGQGLGFVRQMYSGKIVAEHRFKSEAGIVTIRPGVFAADNPERSARMLSRAAPAITVRRRFIGYEEMPTSGVDITKAAAIVAVGRGIKEQKNMALVESLARALNAEIACSRPVIDAGWLPKDRQIGSSGKTVKPKLYIGLGVSGAFQHIAGVKAETIIAVNKDPNAPIFSIAHYGIVGDILKVMPVLEAKIKELKGS